MQVQYSLEYVGSDGSSRSWEHYVFVTFLSSMRVILPPLHFIIIQLNKSPVPDIDSALFLAAQRCIDGLGQPKQLWCWFGVLDASN